jgi:hypothetical protein
MTDLTESQEYADMLAEAYMQINRAHIREALERGELEPIAEDIANLE